MARSGAETMRIAFYWWSMQPQPGEIDFTDQTVKDSISEMTRILNEDNLVGGWFPTVQVDKKIEFNGELRDRLKSAGLLTRDPRKKERKKYGQKGARARFQFSKR